MSSNNWKYEKVKTLKQQTQRSLDSGFDGLKIAGKKLKNSKKQMSPRFRSPSPKPD